MKNRDKEKVEDTEISLNNQNDNDYVENTVSENKNNTSATSPEYISGTASKKIPSSVCGHIFSDSISDYEGLEYLKNTDYPLQLKNKLDHKRQDIFQKPHADPDYEKSKSYYKKILDIFQKKGFMNEKYSYIKHGPLVDFTIPGSTTYKEISIYPVNPPYSYVRIVYEPEKHEYQYHVIEPILTEKEKELFYFLQKRLAETFNLKLDNGNKKGSGVQLHEHIDQLLNDYKIFLLPKNRERIIYYMIRDFVEYDKIDPMMKDPNLEDISCDGPGTQIYVYHVNYGSIVSNVSFENDDELDSFVIKVAQLCNKHISIANPLLDATLPDGSRVQLTLGREVTTLGSNFTIRRFKENPMIPSELVDNNTFSTEMMTYFWFAINSSNSIIFAGGTASGKTTSMNAVSMFINPEMKIVSIEDTRELNLHHPNWIPTVTRQSFAGEERGSIEMYELLKAALRQRPEYIIVGEVRGSEAYVLFQAMSTGHTTLSTIHADSVSSVIHRLENPPINIPRIMIQALKVVAILEKVNVSDKRVRRCTSITEIVGLDPRTGELLTNDVFIWNSKEDTFQYTGKSYIFDSIMQNMSLTEQEMNNEIIDRQHVIQWASMRSIKDYTEFSKIIVEYSREPEKMMERIQKDLEVYG